MAKLAWAVVAWALLAGVPVVAYAQSDPGADAPRNVAAPNQPNTTAANGDGAAPNESVLSARNGPKGGGGLRPCSSGPPYTSLPCLPPQR